jgi:hypothetical protein
MALIAASGACAAPITFNTALPVSKGGLIYRQQAIVTRSADNEGGDSREVTEVMGISVLGYGVTPKLAAFGVLPVLYRDSEIGARETDEFGVGDASFFARYEIFRSDAPGRTLRLAPFAGLNLPTGERGETGDGAADFFGGLILTAAATDWNFDGQIQYVANREAKGFKRGDAISADASLQYRLLPAEGAANDRGFLFAVLEFNVTSSDENRLLGVDDPNSGGVQVFLSPGLQYAAKRWIAEAAVRVPVVNDPGGSALGPDYALIAGLRFNF